MVFRKLSVEEREEIASFAAEINPGLIPAVRALTMRGCTPDEARIKVLERDVDEVVNPKTKRRKKVNAAEVAAPEAAEVDQAKPKPKRRSKVVDTEEPAKPKQTRRKATKVEDKEADDKTAPATKQRKSKAKTVEDVKVEAKTATETTKRKTKAKTIEDANTSADLDDAIIKF